MTDFVPPYPERPKSALPPLAFLSVARRNMIAIFEEKCFEYQFFSARVLNRQLFVCNSPDTVAQAFIEKHDSFERKTPQVRNALSPIIGADASFISDGANWRKRRRLVAPIIHVSKLATFAPTMVEAAHEVAERWAAQPAGTPVDALRDMATLTAEIICRTVFGPRLGAEHATTVVASFTEFQRVIGQTDIAYYAGLPEWVPRFNRPAVYLAARRIHNVLDDIIRRVEEGRAAGESSMIQLLLEARDPETGEALDRTAVRNEAAVLFMAGHEGTANSLAWSWYLLSQAPEAEARLHAELDEVLGGRLPTHDDVPKLVFTRAVFEEAMRLYPPVPLLGRQALRDEAIRNRPIPTGSLVVVAPWLLHRHKRLWDNPDHFIPERFLPENADKRQRYSYIPFSVGPRVCTGAAFAMTEALLCLATLAQRVRLRLAPGTVVEPVCRLTLRPGQTLPMLIEPRA